MGCNVQYFVDIEERIDMYERLLEELEKKAGERLGREQKLLILSALRKAYSEGKLVKMLRKWGLVSGAEDPDLLVKETIETLYNFMRSGLDLTSDEACNAILYILNLRELPPQSLVTAGD